MCGVARGRRPYVRASGSASVIVVGNRGGRAADGKAGVVHWHWRFTRGNGLQRGQWNIGGWNDGGGMGTGADVRGGDSLDEGWRDRVGGRRDPQRCLCGVL